MSFIRYLDKKQVAALYSDKNIYLFNILKNEIKNGVVFPAVRKNRIYFYYAGGCLYRFANGCFSRNPAYEKYALDAENLSPYEAAKRQVENKFTNTNGNDKERRLLNTLYHNTYCCKHLSDTVVLDIEVNFNGNVATGKKCDLVLYNKISRELIFAEGKVFFDKRVNVKCGNVPEVIEQVNAYSAAIAEQKHTIAKQYENYVNIVNELFGTNYLPPLKIIERAKLLVFETPLSLTDNNSYSIDQVTGALGANNIIWFKQNERPTIDEIWNTLCK